MSSTGQKSKTTIFTSLGIRTAWIHRALAFLERLWRYSHDVIGRFEQHHVYLLAAGVAFNVMLCIIPLLGLTVIIAWHFVPLEFLQNTITSALAGALPPTRQIHELVQYLLAEVERVRTYALTATVIAAVVLLWTASTLLSSLRTAFNAIFGISNQHSFVIGKLRDLGLTLLLVGIVLVMLLLTPLLSVMSSNIAELTPWLEPLHISGWVSFAANLGSSFVLMFLLFHFVPSKPQPLPVILRASIVTVVLWELARVAFTLYIENASMLGAIYGTFSLLVIGWLWVYYTVLIVLVSAEVAKYGWERHIRRT